MCLLFLLVDTSYILPPSKDRSLARSYEASLASPENISLEPSEDVSLPPTSEKLEEVGMLNDASQRISHPVPKSITSLLTDASSPGP
jgi:hypothetical protein